MKLEDYREKISKTPELITFEETMLVIDTLYQFCPTEFKNGKILNNTDQNQGSCKLFYFAKMQEFSKEQTLHAFGTYYREDVLKFPDDQNHGNIRSFMHFGWKGIDFGQEALHLKK